MGPGEGKDQHHDGAWVELKGLLGEGGEGKATPLCTNFRRENERENIQHSVLFLLKECRIPLKNGCVLLAVCYPVIIHPQLHKGSHIIYSTVNAPEGRSKNQVAVESYFS